MPLPEIKVAQPAVLNLEEIHIICSIMQVPPENPIVASDGYIYDASNLQQWIDQGKRTSPISRAKLKETLIPFNLLKKILSEASPYQLKETDLICPLTKRFMRKPILASDGNLYEEDAIKKALHPRTPLLFEPRFIKEMREKLLKENPDLQKRISEEGAREDKYEPGNNIPAELLKLKDDEPLAEEKEEEANDDDLGRFRAELMITRYSIIFIHSPAGPQLALLMSSLSLSESGDLAIVRSVFPLPQSLLPQAPQMAFSPPIASLNEHKLSQPLPEQNNQQEHKYAEPEESIFQQLRHQPYPTLSSNHSRDFVWPGQNNAEDHKHVEPAASHLEPRPQSSQLYPPLPPPHNRREAVWAVDRSALSSSLEAYYGSRPLTITDVKDEEKSVAVTFSLENAGPKLKRFSAQADNHVHFKIDAARMVEIDAENAATHKMLVIKLKNYLSQLDGADENKVIAFVKSRTFASNAPKKTRIQELRDMLMKDLPENFLEIAPRPEHYPIINRNLNQFQSALDHRDQALFGTPRNSFANARSFFSCGRYLPSPPQGENLMQEINGLVKTKMTPRPSG